MNWYSLILSEMCVWATKFSELVPKKTARQLWREILPLRVVISIIIIITIIMTIFIFIIIIVINISIFMIVIIMKITTPSTVIGLRNSYFHQFTCLVDIGQFVIRQFNKPVTFKVVV